MSNLRASLNSSEHFTVNHTGNSWRTYRLTRGTSPCSKLTPIACYPLADARSYTLTLRDGKDAEDDTLLICSKFFITLFFRPRIVTHRLTTGNGRGGTQTSFASFSPDRLGTEESMEGRIQCSYRVPTSKPDSVSNWDIIFPIFSRDSRKRRKPSGASAVRGFSPKMTFCLCRAEGGRWSPDGVWFDPPERAPHDSYIK